MLPLSLFLSLSLPLSLSPVKNYFVDSNCLVSVKKVLCALLLSQIKVGEDGKIVDAKFKTFGCGSAIASSSLATEWVKGKSVSQHGLLVLLSLIVFCLYQVEEATEIKNTDIAKELSLPPVKLHCSSECQNLFRSGTRSI